MPRARDITACVEIQNQWALRKWQMPTGEFPVGISTVGVEFEGVWSTPNPAVVEPLDGCYDCDEEAEYICDSCKRSAAYRDYNLKGDPSVSNTEHYIPATGHVAVTGEHASEVCHDWNELRDVAKYYYPSAVNRTCGMHVHVYCENEVLLKFTNSEGFYRLLRQALTPLTHERINLNSRTVDWLENRLDSGRSASGLTAFAMPNFMTYQSYMEDNDRAWASRIRSNAYERYCWVNFDAYGTHHTVEFRVLPMANGGRNEAMFMIQNLLTAVSTYWTDERYWDKCASSVLAEKDIIIEPDDQIVNTPQQHRVVSTTHHKIGRAEEIDERTYDLEETNVKEDA
jgi:hypothetical protein